VAVFILDPICCWRLGRAHARVLRESKRVVVGAAH
jgi:hypothetical protein